MTCVFNPLIYHIGCTSQCVQRFNFSHDFPRELFLRFATWLDNRGRWALASTCKALMCSVRRLRAARLQFIHQRPNNLACWDEFPGYIQFKLPGIRFVKRSLVTATFARFAGMGIHQYMYRRFKYCRIDAHFYGVLRRPIISSELVGRRHDCAEAALRQRFPAELELPNAIFRARLYWDDLIVEYDGICRSDCQTVVKYTMTVLQKSQLANSAKMLRFLGIHNV